MEKIEIINVDESLVDLTSSLASEVFIDHFKNIIGQEQAEYMVDRFLSKKAISEELSQGTIFKLCYVNGEAVAFTEYKLDDKRVFLSKLYVRKDMRKKGLSHLLLDDVIKYTLDQKRNKIYLTVNKYNDNTIAVYKHWGFDIIDAVVNDIGHGYVMDDYIMEKTL